MATSYLPSSYVLPFSSATLVPLATGAAKPSSGGSNGGAVAGGVIAALVIVSAVGVAAFLCFLYIRRLKGKAHFNGLQSCTKVTSKMIGSACPCLALARKRPTKDDAYEPIQMGQMEHTDPMNFDRTRVDVAASIRSGPYEPVDVNMCSVTAAIQIRPYEPMDMNTSSIVTTSAQGHPYEPVDTNMSSIVTSAYEPVDVNTSSIVSSSLNPYEPVEVGKTPDKDISPSYTKDTDAQLRYTRAPTIAVGDRGKVETGFTNTLALVPEEATRAALYGSYDVPRPIDPYDIPRGSSMSHPPPPTELYDTPKSSQYDKPRSSVSIHPPKDKINPSDAIPKDNINPSDAVPKETVNPSDATSDAVSHTYDDVTM